MSHRSEINSIIKQVESWSTEDRQTLAHELLNTSTSSFSGEGASKDTLSLAQAVAASVRRPPPTDDEVMPMMAEHRIAKYRGGGK